MVKADFEIYFRGEDFDETLIIKKNIWVAIKTITNGENIFLDGSGIVFVEGGGGYISWGCGGSSICYITPEWACSGHTGRLWPHVASLGRRSSGPRSAHWRQGTSLRSGPPSPPTPPIYCTGRPLFKKFN